MLVLILIVLNLPVYIFLGWILFDSKEHAADSLFETIVEILKSIFIPRIVRVFMDDEDGGVDGFHSFLLIGLSIAVVYGEYYLITKYWLTANG